MSEKEERLRRELVELEAFEMAALDFVACMDLNRIEDAAHAFNEMRKALVERGHKDAVAI